MCEGFSSAKGTPRKRSAPRRSGKSIFLHQGARPMVAATARTPVQLSAAMERICNGEPAHNLRGKLSSASKAKSRDVSPEQQTPKQLNLDSAYPRHGSIHSLQYHNIAERAGACMAPGAGRSSVSGVDQVAQNELTGKWMDYGDVLGSADYGDVLGSAQG
jgi:hypothetical protein